MVVDYEAIANDQARLERTAANSIRTLANLYAERAHFVYELLQNAEDALRRRPSGWRGSRTVTFRLSADSLRIIHCGEPFNTDDVQSICSVGETTKELTDIGRFGIGFKSVYSFTDRPEFHSGRHDFAIEQYVRPVGVSLLPRGDDETLIVLPLHQGDSGAIEEITTGLKRLGARTLLFLREVEEIEWTADDGPSGLYLRSQPELLGEAVRRVTLLGQAVGEPDVEETWLVFSRRVATEDGAAVGHVEIAFLVAEDEDLGRETVLPVLQSPLVAFFPTVLETHLGFLLQGPYRTTPSRDNVPRRDPWNQRCMQETARVLADALRWLRDNDLLDTSTLRTLPLDGEKFSEGSMFEPLFRATKDLLAAEALLPRFGGGYAPAVNAKLARTQDLRELFDPARLTGLFDADGELAWLSGDISQDRTPELRQYLMRELEIAEVTPEMLLPRLTAGFLGAQPDDWILRLYEFLNGQPALRQRALTLPLIRLVDGTQVPALKAGQPQAFLPSDIETGFPTVRPAVCGSDSARKFLVSLGLTEPDPVDDVVWNVLPKYREDEIDISDDVYDSDIRRIVAAFASDSKSQREKLLATLRETPFVMVVDTGDAREYVSKAGDVYLATERLKELFASVPDVLRVDDRYPCLRGEDVRELLEACGAVRHLRPVADDSLPWEERRRLREQAGHADTSGQKDRITDWTLLGLPGLLATLPGLPGENRYTRAGLLWEELAHLEERRGKGVFTGEYSWTHYGSYRTTFDAAFVRLLNETAWVPDADGELSQPGTVLFDSLDWKPSPFLLSKIRFKPPIIDQLAKEAGFEPGVLDLLKQRGITSTAHLRELLGVEDEPHDNREEPGDVDEALKRLLGDAPAPTPPVPDPAIADPRPVGGDGSGARDGAGGGSGRTGTGSAGPHGNRQGECRGKGPGPAGGKRTPGSVGGRPFISYVAVHPDEDELDPDGLDQAARMALEARAIEFILEQEPDWQCTPASNPGYDLFQAGPDREPSRWCEVKAMSGRLNDQPVGLSRTQFDCAREHGGDYWLYIVEQAGTSDGRIVRIQDPAGKARTFTFDRGWLDIAAVDPEQESRKD
jgi:hypothetical protein